ncbi:hypothetical protein A0H81_12501 [Grifola frondosa]|uniref:Uncharacterized protein n=1 Tax=Grifola frondosa TaxID=5627 RepID=A0A1C7LU58_GRIFR|nr:hypothetical protein A0H81_12501 [Grifola frondosa]
MGFVQLIAHTLKKYNCVATEASQEGYYWSPERYEGNVWTPVLHRHRAVIASPRATTLHIPVGAGRSTSPSSLRASAQSSQHLPGFSPPQSQSSTTPSAPIYPHLYSDLIVSPVFVPPVYFHEMTPPTSHLNRTMIDTYIALGLPFTNGLCTLAMALGPNSDARDYAIKVAPDTGARDTWVFANDFRKLDNDWNETDWSREERAMPIFYTHRRSRHTVNSLRSKNLPEAKLEYLDLAMLKVCIVEETLKFVAGRYDNGRAPISIDRFPLSIALAANEDAMKTHFSGMLGLAPAGSSPLYPSRDKTFLQTLMSRAVILEVEVEVMDEALLDCGSYASVFSNECRDALYARKGASWVRFAFANDIAGQIRRVTCDARTFLYHRGDSSIDHEVVLGTSAPGTVILGLNFFRCVFIGFNDADDQVPRPFVQIAPAYRSEVAQYRYTV